MNLLDMNAKTRLEITEIINWNDFYKILNFNLTLCESTTPI